MTSRPIPKATVFADPPFAIGSHVPLGEDEIRHLHVVRMAIGDRVALRDGAGHTAEGQLVRLSKTQALVEVDETIFVDPPSPIHLLLPVADRDRMLWLAEKATELNVTSWRPVIWKRSKSVSPRGEGQTFRTKVRARMISAMLQSRSAWLPEIFPESPPDRAIAAAPGGDDVTNTERGVRIALDILGAPLCDPTEVLVRLPITLAVGPEGGFEPSEIEQLLTGGFTLCTLGPSTLRFETAAIAGIAVVRCLTHPLYA